MTYEPGHHVGWGGNSCGTDSDHSDQVSSKSRNIDIVLYQIAYRRIIKLV